LISGSTLLDETIDFLDTGRARLCFLPCHEHFFVSGATFGPEINAGSIS
jgi:hypothetical protein